MSCPIERKLRTEFSPYLVTAKHLGRWRLYRIYTVYSYFGEVFVLLGGFGLTNPVISFLSSGHGIATIQKKQESSTIVDFLSSNQLGWLSILLLIVYGLVKFYIKNESLEKRCSLITSYRRQCLQIENALRTVLSQPNPMSDLIPLQAKLSDLVDRNIAEGSIPDIGIDDSLEKEFDAHCQKLINDFSERWELPPDEDQRKKNESQNNGQQNKNRSEP